jgi:hypothetical protein
VTDAPKKSFAQMRQELAAQRGRHLPVPEAPRKLHSVPPIAEDLIPEVYDESEDDLAMDSIIDSIDILDAYRRWIGKEVDEKTTSQTEGIKVSCPFPGHRDKDPSAWLNSDSRTWYCGGCQEGGDLYDIAAIKFGYQRPDYKDGKAFHDLRRDMAEAYGYRVKVISGKEVIWREDEPAQEPVQKRPNVPTAKSADHSVESAPEATAEPATEARKSITPPAPSASGASVTTLREGDVTDEPDTIGYPSLDWRSIVAPDTFLWEYMSACSNDDSPEEYHFWHGLLALGHAVGRNVYLDDLKLVYGNLLICLLGGTGYGKTRSQGWLEWVMEEAVPFRNNGLDTSGCKMMSTPGSGENLIKQFEHIAMDPSLPKGSPIVKTPVNGIVNYDEFAGLLSRAMRPGNTLKVTIQAMSDAKPRVSTASNTGGEFEAIKPYCSIIASTQPSAVRTLLSKYDTGSGFLNRWLFVGGPRKKRESIGGRRTRIRVDLSPAIRELKAVRAWGAIEREVTLTDDGYEEWDRWFHTQLEPLQINDETELLSRLSLTMKRILLLMAINERKTEVTAADVKRIQVFVPYLIECYSILNAEIGISEISEISQEILRHAKRIQEQTNRGVTARELGQRMKRKNYSPDMIKRALDTMVGLDWLDIEKNKGPGRPSIRYKVVGE